MRVEPDSHRRLLLDGSPPPFEAVAPGGFTENCRPSQAVNRGGPLEEGMEYPPPNREKRGGEWEGEGPGKWGGLSSERVGDEAAPGCYWASQGEAVCQSRGGETGESSGEPLEPDWEPSGRASSASGSKALSSRSKS